LKNLSLILNAILIIAVSILYYMHFNEKKAAPPLDSQKQSQIVYVNSDSLLDNYEYIIQAKKELEEHHQKAEADFNAKGEAFQNAVKAYQARAQSMTPDQMQYTEKDLKEKEEVLMQYKDELTKELAKKEQELDERLFTAIRDYLKKNVGGKNYNYVLGYTKGGGILYANDSLDITKTLLDGLNKEYREKNK
jgi:outer membrane protein